MKGLRRVVVPGPEEWTYKIFSSCMVLFDPAGKKYVVSLPVLSGWDWNSIENGGLRLGPKDVVDFIQWIRDGKTITEGGGHTWKRCTHPGCKDACMYLEPLCQTHYYEKYPRCKHKTNGVYKETPYSYQCRATAEPDGYCPQHWPGCDEEVQHA